VCPQETQCEAQCVRGIKGEPVAIGRLERFVADWYRENINEMPSKAEPNGKKVAVVGSGPAGMTCASDLAKLGYAVTMFEALHTAGGVLVYGIPEFRLPKAIVANEVKKLEAQGVEVMTNMVIGRVLTIDELFEMGYEAVFVGSGAGLPMFMNIPGESLNGVFSANDPREAIALGAKIISAVFLVSYLNRSHVYLSVIRVKSEENTAGKRIIVLTVVDCIVVRGRIERRFNFVISYGSYFRSLVCGINVESAVCGYTEYALYSVSVAVILLVCVYGKLMTVKVKAIWLRYVHGIDKTYIRSNRKIGKHMEYLTRAKLDRVRPEA